MAISLKVDLGDLDPGRNAPLEVMRALEAVTAAPADFLDDIGAGLVSSTQHRFETGTDPDGNAWVPSARAEREGGQTLVDRGHLRDSVTHQVGGGSVAVGSDLVYAGIHQLGGEIRAKGAGGLAFRIGDRFVLVGKVTIPARPFLGVDADDEAEIGAILQDHIRDAMEAGR